ncbi:hypothetical protein PJP13_29655, partial [Mycobacterium kansasii]
RKERSVHGRQIYYRPAEEGEKKEKKRKKERKKGRKRDRSKFPIHASTRTVRIKILPSSLVLLLFFSCSSKSFHA